MVGCGESTNKYAIIIPIHNEEESLSDLVEEILLRVDVNNTRIYLCEDGSMDDTLKIAQNLSHKHSNVKVFHSTSRLGKSKAIIEAVKRIEEPAFAFIDADMPDSASYLPKLLEAVHGGSDVVVGSRYLNQSGLKRGILRLVPSMTYNLLIRFVFDSKFTDHNCGLKAFSTKAFLKLVTLSDSREWGGDVEWLVWAQKLGMRIEEISIPWSERTKGHSKVNLLFNIPVRAADLIHLKATLWRKR